jgi:ribose transport system permease protein
MMRTGKVADAGAWLVQNRLIIILTITLAVGAAVVPSFLTETTLGLSLDRASTLGIIAVGLTVLLLAGQIDLSSGAVLALSGITAIAAQSALGPTGAVAAGLLIGAAVGLVNGILVVYLHINSLIATLATMLAVRAVAHLVTDSQPVTGADPLFGLGVGLPMVWVLTQRTVIFLVAILLLALWLTRTVPGRNLFAIGSNAASASASGVRVNLYLLGAFVFAGFCAGAAGVLQSLSINTGSPVFGDALTVAVIAAVVVGGTRIEGGRGSALGTLGGVVTLAALTTAMEYRSVPAYTQSVVTGLILILLIVLDRAIADQPPRPRIGLRLKALTGTRAGA